MVPAAVLDGLTSVGLPSSEAREVHWLRGLFTATADGRHVPEDWTPGDRHRRSAFRVLGRAAVLYGHASELSWEEAVRSTVAYGDGLRSDPVLSGIEEAAGWGGILLRNYSVGAWRRLWAGMVNQIGTDPERADASADELRAWLVDQMPDMTVRDFLGELPATMTEGCPAEAEREVLRDVDERDALVNVKLLMIGARRHGELTGVLHKAFMGPSRDYLNPEWVSVQLQEFRASRMSDFAARLVNDMLDQARRVAIAKMRSDNEGRLVVYSRLHQRNGRYYRTDDEGWGTPDTRVERLADMAGQLGLIHVDGEGRAVVTEIGQELLEVTG